MDRCSFCEEYFKTEEGHLCPYSFVCVDELEKIEKLRIARESEKSASEASLDTNIQRQDLGKERSISFERDSNFSTKCLSQGHQITSSPVEPFITQYHKESYEVYPYDSPVAYQSISEDIEVNKSLFDTSQVNFFMVDDSSSNPNPHFSATNVSVLCNLTPAFLQKCKNISPSLFSKKENMVTETFHRKNSSLHLTKDPSSVFLGNNDKDEANKPKDFRNRERIFNEVTPKNDFSKEKIDRTDKSFTSVLDTEAAPVAGPSGIKPKSYSEDAKKGFVCDVCSKSFGQKSNLLAHFRTHIGEKTFVCGWCGKSFNREDNLTTHLRTHTRDRPFACDTCGKEFSRKFNLERHMLPHTGEKPFTCNECGKKFYHKHHLDRHLRTHKGEKPYKCEVCGMCLADKGSCKRHQKRKHGGK